MTDGIAIVSSEHGAIQITDENGRSFSPKLHETLVLSGSTIKTGKGAHLFIALSNGMGIGIKESSEVMVNSYQQRPFSAIQQSIRHEPSASELSLQIAQGTIALAGNRLAPVSRAHIELPHGNIRIHSATCIVQCNESATKVTASAGALTYYYPDKAKRKFVVGPQSLHISQQDTEPVLETQNVVLADLAEDPKQLAAATERASQRVFFKANASGEAPHPVLIVSPDYFEQPAARPYQFNE